MKRLHLHNLRLNALLAVMVLGIFSCTNPEDLLNGTSVNVHNDFLINPMTIQVLNYDGGEVPKDISVSAYGPDKDHIFTVLGEKDLTVSYSDADQNAAFLSLAVRRITAFDEEDPLEFTLKFEAEGYMPVFRNFSLTDEDRTMQNIRMFPVSASNIDGMNKEEVSIAQSGNGTLELVSARTPASQNGQRISIEVAPNTRMMDQSGKSIAGNVEAHVISYDYTNRFISSLAPVSLFANNARSQSGEELGFLNFAPVAVYSIDMYGAEGEVKQFDQPIKVEVEIPAGTPHPETGALIKVGDELEAWSFNEGFGDWQEEGSAKIVSENGDKLIAHFEQTHLSTWFLGGRIFCRPSTRFLIQNSNQPKIGPQTYYFVEVVNTLNNNIVNTFSFTRFFDGEVITVIVPAQFQNAPAILQFNIYQYQEDATPLYTSPLFAPCGDQLIINLDDVLAPPPGLGTKFFVNVSGTCSAGFSNFVVRPTLPLQFRPSGATAWNPLGWLDAGEGASMALEKGRFYDFRIAYRTLDRCVFNLQVPTQDSTVIIESSVYQYGPSMPFSETIDVDYVDTDNDGFDETVFFNYTNINVPDQACQEYIDFLNAPIN
ncbi:MAG: hypothetical protein RIC19_25255 [Phaeodactylibacter sp.]|uniref:hypothetical protein n=1 Tax=Phaeodactylibacter sp. TaxID=1940289 RepID=UPI0032ECC4DC